MTRKQLKEDRKYLKQYKVRLTYKLSKTKWFQLIYRNVLNRKIENVDIKIRDINKRLRNRFRY